MDSRKVIGCVALALAGLSAAPLPEDAGQPSPIVEGRIPDASALKAVLESLSYAPTDAGNGIWTISRTSNTWTLGMTLQVNSDASIVWITCYIGTLDRAESYAASHYLSLLDMQGRFSPRFFFTTQAADGLRLHYARGLDNRALTPEIVGAEIAALQDALAANGAVWNYNGWTRAEAAPPPADPPPPGGR